MWGTRLVTVILALALWCMIWQRYEIRGIGYEHPGLEAEIRLLEYQAMSFGTVLGIGLGVVLGVGLYKEMEIYWVVVVCVGWALVWGMVGVGVTWVCEGRRLRLEWVSIGGLRAPRVFRFVEFVVGNLVLGLWWMLCMLCGVVMESNGSASGSMGQGPETVSGAFENTSDRATTERRTGSVTPDWLDTSSGDEAPGDQLQEDDGATVLEDVNGAESPLQPGSSARRRTVSRGRLTRERKALGLTDEHVDDGGLEA